jgi:predicted transcriptional regulator
MTNPFLKSTTTTVEGFKLISRSCLTVQEKIDLTAAKESIYISSMEYFKIVEDASKELGISTEEILKSFEDVTNSNIPQQTILDILVKLKEAKNKADEADSIYSFYIMGYLLKSRIVRQQVEQLEEAYGVQLDSLDDYIFIVKQLSVEVFEALMNFFIAEESATNQPTTKKKVKRSTQT